MEKQSVEEMRAEPGRKLPPVRRSQEERRRSTKLAVLRAVLDLLVDEGYLKLTVADVAERAQVSRGALSHYFRTKQDLVVAAACFAMDEAMERIDRLSVQSETPLDAVEAFLDDAEDFFLSRNYAAQIELTFAGKHDPMLADIYFPFIAQYRTRFDAAWLKTMIRAGCDAEQAEALIKLTNYLMRGMVLTANWTSDTRERDQVLKVWRRQAFDLIGV
jgi:AcrR family transcriptional regulator